jgi:hypothetical protein
MAIHPAVRAAVTPARPGDLRGRRWFVDPSANDVDFAAAERELMRAMQEYRERSGRMFPTWSEVLEVLERLGYEKRGGDRHLAIVAHDGGADDARGSS